MGEITWPPHILGRIERLKRWSDNGAHMRIPAGGSAGEQYELAVEIELLLAHVNQQHEAVIREKDAEMVAMIAVAVSDMRQRAERAEAQRDELARRATLVLQYLDPVLSSGTFSATDEAIHIASLLSGGDGCGALDTTNKPL